MRKLLLSVFMMLILIGSLAHAAPADTYELRIVLGADTHDPELLETTRQAVERRVNGLFMPVEVTIEDSTIVIKLNGRQDDLLELAPRIIELSMQPGLLEFVDFSNLSGLIPEEGDCISTTAQLNLYELPLCENPGVRVDTQEPYQTILTGEAVAEAEAIHNEQVLTWGVGITFKEEAGEIFEEFTRTHINQPLAIVLDGKVLSAPTIQSAIIGEVHISGNFTQEDVENLANQLRYGALPVVLTLVEVHLIIVE